MLNKRTNILFGEEMWSRLLACAQVYKTSVGELVRKAVDEVYPPMDKRSLIKNAVKNILTIRKSIKPMNYRRLIDYGRKY